MKSQLILKLFPLIASLTDTNAKRGLILAISALTVYLIRKRLSTSRVKNKLQHDDEAIKKEKVKALVDKKFIKKLKKLLKIAIPRWVGRETISIAVLSALLAIRTVLSIQISDVNGSIVKAIVKINFYDFVYRIFELGLYSLPSSAVNSGLEHFGRQIGLYMRENITRHFHEKYLNKMCFYQINNLDSRIINPDQIFTNDVEKWAYSLSNLYSNFTKPLLDIVLFSKKLSETIGVQGPIWVFFWYILTILFLRFISPPFGKLIAMEQNLEGEFRACHTGIITHAEEIAFYRGNKWEKERVNADFDDLIAHKNDIYLKRFYMGVFDSMIYKYGANIVGYCLLAVPVFTGDNKKYTNAESGAIDASNITKDYIRNSAHLINLSKALGRIIVSYKEVQNLAGYTYLVRKLDKVMTEVNEGKFVRTQVNSDFLKNYVGKMEDSENIEFHDVPIITPNGDRLVEKFNFKIEQGHHVLITGPNGCGKSSLFRILGSLWPLYGGVVKKPNLSEIFYIPQRPYLPTGTLRDQIIYPMSVEEFKKQGKTDEMVMSLFDLVELSNIKTRFSTKGLDTVRDWKEVLSGGEKQKIAMARLYFHCPKYAILDECTSAVSMDVENIMYTNAKKLGITLITVSHRPSLWKFHQTCIRFLGDGQLSIEEIKQGHI